MEMSYYFSTIIIRYALTCGQGRNCIVTFLVINCSLIKSQNSELKSTIINYDHEMKNRHIPTEPLTGMNPSIPVWLHSRYYLLGIHRWYCGKAPGSTQQLALAPILNYEVTGLSTQNKSESRCSMVTWLPGEGNLGCG